MKTTSVSGEQLDALFDALANGHRRSILHTLAFRPATVKQLASREGMTLPAIHKHIRQLETARLIERRKVGRTNFIALNQLSLKVVQDWAFQYRADWGNNQQTLENYIASMQ